MQSHGYDDYNHDGGAETFVPKDASSISSVNSPVFDTEDKEG